MKKKYILLWSFALLLTAGLLYASGIYVWMTGATYHATPPNVRSGGSGIQLPDMGYISVTWRCDMDSQYEWTETGPLDLECNGSTIATDIAPYACTSAYDPVEDNYDITGYYKYVHTITSSGTYTYEAEHADNSVSVTVP